jgi:glycosyltransferase involved in cell wall biosynthesis
MNLSVIVIAHNEEKYLPRLLSALEEQTWREFELIVVDSDSTDATCQVAREYADRFKQFRLLKLGVAEGPGYARNRGAEAAGCERLLFLDADSYIEEDFLQACMDELQAHDVDVATCPIRIFEQSFLSNLGARFLNLLLRVFRPVYPAAYGACLFSTRSVHERVGGFHEELGLCEDCHYVKKVRKHADLHFRILHRIFYTSDRRARAEGQVRVMIKYLTAHAYRLLTGKEISRDQVDYSYGNH